MRSYLGSPSRSSLAAGFTLPLLLILLSLSPAPAVAQSISWGSLNGQIVDELGDPISDVEIRIANRATGAVRSVVSTRGGSFRLDAVTPGAYELTAEAVGYRPKVVLSVPVRAGRITRLEVPLRPERPPVLGRDTVSFVSPGGSWMVPGSVHTLGTAELATLPDQGRRLDDAFRYVTGLSSGAAGEGLSARHTGIFLDGLPLRVARHPTAPDNPHLFGALTRSGLSQAEVLLGDPEIEWARAAGPLVSAYTRSAGSRRAFRVFGDWTGASLWSSSESEDGPPGNHSFRGGFVADLPSGDDGPRLTVGGEAQRLQSPRPAFGVPAQTVAGLDLGPFGDVHLQETTRASAFGRVDWKLSRSSALAVRAQFGTVLEPEGPFSAAPLVPGHPMSSWGTDVTLGATYATELQNRLRVEVRLGFDRSDRKFRGPSISGVAYPWTQFVSTGLALGTHPVFPADVTWQTVHLAPAVYLDYDEHQFKLGAYAGIPQYTYDYTFNGVAEVFTTDATSLTGGQGIYTLTNGASDAPEFEMQSYGVFVEDLWDVRSDFRVQVGARFDVDQLPEGWRRSVLWDSLSTQPRPEFPGELQGVSGRAGFEWDASQTTVVRGAAGIHYEPTDPATIASVLYEDGDVRVRHGRNGLLVWPDMASGPVDFFGPRYTFLGDDFENPRAMRASLGVSRALADGVTGHVWGVFRRTESLTRRVDLNRDPAPSGLDQYGRPVYGDLFKRQSVVAATWPTNRLLTNFEYVHALESDGWSQYWGVGAALERRSGSPLRWFASYTFSRTEDNLVGASAAHPEAQLNPFAGTDLAARWAESTSDYDVPHRLAGGVEWDVQGMRGLTLSGRYTLRSGVPFTAGFRTGVDVNGDGSAHNDPAYVDDAAALSGLTGEWGCLEDAVGGFAERNACRGPMLHSLDARISFSGLSLGGQTLEIVIDGLNLLDAKNGDRDNALFLIDPSVPIAEIGTVRQIPYLTNQEFGRLLRPWGPGRWFRVGVQIRP